MRIRSLAALLVLAPALSCVADHSMDVPTVAAILFANPQTAINPGRQFQLPVFAFAPSGIVIVNPGTFVWASSAESVATVTQTGVVTTLTPGISTISASLGGTAGTIDIVVTALTPATKDTIITLPAAFFPTVVTIGIGQSVTFSFAGGDLHNVIFRSTNPAGAPADIPDTKNLVFTRTFMTPGTYTYDCLIHRNSATIVVQ